MTFSVTNDLTMPAAGRAAHDSAVQDLENAKAAALVPRDEHGRPIPGQTKPLGAEAYKSLMARAAGLSLAAKEKFLDWADGLAATGGLAPDAQRIHVDVTDFGTHVERIRERSEKGTVSGREYRNLLQKMQRL